MCNSGLSPGYPAIRSEDPSHGKDSIQEAARRLHLNFLGDRGQ